MRPLHCAKLAMLATFLPWQRLGDQRAASRHTNSCLLCFSDAAKKGKGKD